MPSSEVDTTTSKQQEDGIKVINTNIELLQAAILSNGRNNILFQLRNYFKFQNESKDISVPSQIKLVKIERSISIEGTVDPKNEPLNFKKDSSTNIDSKTMEMDVEPSITSSDTKEMEVSNTITTPSTTLTSTTKVYANLESAMPVSGLTAQPPITIQTIEVIINLGLHFSNVTHLS